MSPTEQPRNPADASAPDTVVSAAASAASAAKDTAKNVVAQLAATIGATGTKSSEAPSANGSPPSVDRARDAAVGDLPSAPETTAVMDVPPTAPSAASATGNGGSRGGAAADLAAASTIKQAPSPGAAPTARQPVREQDSGGDDRGAVAAAPSQPAPSSTPSAPSSPPSSTPSAGPSTSASAGSAPAVGRPVFKPAGESGRAVTPQTPSGSAAVSAGGLSNGVSTTSATTTTVPPTATSAPPPVTARPSAPPVPSGLGSPRTVRLTVARVNPWSVLKLSFLLSVALGIALVVATILLWQVLNGLGLFTTLDRTISDIGGVTNFDIYNYAGLSRVVSIATLVAVINLLIVMAMATLLAFLYNIASSLVGGLQVTLSDD